MVIIKPNKFFGAAPIPNSKKYNLNQAPRIIAGKEKKNMIIIKQKSFINDMVPSCFSIRISNTAKEGRPKMKRSNMINNFFLLFVNLNSFIKSYLIFNFLNYYFLA
ncbi:hypothetical protein KAU33_12335 [Candidatus Dependentiae bacterium]|nr:hypothetical protein [Candidatus Dependentiae bacterium]